MQSVFATQLRRPWREELTPFPSRLISMENEPKQPPETKPDGIEPDPDARKGHGVPPGATEEEPTGMPNSDRHQTEVTPART